MGNDDTAALDLRSPTAYGLAFADIYDQWYHDVSDAEGAARFVARRVEAIEADRNSVVVEFGVGTGRLAGPMSKAGLTVIGIDASVPMLQRYVGSDQAQANGLVAADMRAVPLRPSSTSAVVVAFNTLFNVIDVDGQRSVLSEARALVDNHGVVILEALTVDDLPSEPTQSVGVRTINSGDVTVSATQIRNGQIMTGQHIQLSDTGVRIRPWMLRWLTTSQLDELAASVGLELVDRYATWDEQTYLPTSSAHISVYRASNNQNG